MRECLNDVFDLDGLLEVQRQIASRAVRMVEVETKEPSPFARSLLFGYVGAFVYEGDVPLAERKAAALSLDPTLLAELLGKDGIKQLLDGDVIARIEADLQCLSAGRQVTSQEQAFDLLRTAGPFTRVELPARAAPGLDVAEVVDTRSTIAGGRVRIAGARCGRSPKTFRDSRRPRARSRRSCRLIH
jgi:ATP-dependent Lhr-like helicase